MKNTLVFKDSYIKEENKALECLSDNLTSYTLADFLSQNYSIDMQTDPLIVSPFIKDWSNIPGKAEVLARPTSAKECAILLKSCEIYKIPITISAGQTNLTGSATPQGGIVLSTSGLTTPDIRVDVQKREVESAVGIPLEIMRKEVLIQTQNQYYYPVNPTSRNDAFVGGTISCNASGFIPGEKGATRYWVKEIEFMLLNGFHLNIKRGDYISNNGIFIIKCGDSIVELPIPQYKRPDIKNASGPYSSDNNEIDFIDLIIGSEGIYGMLLACKFSIAKRPSDYLELFVRLKNEDKAIELHDFLYHYFNQDMSRISALEYFGYNCKTYMKHKDFLFNNDDEVGVYIQVPIYNDSLDIIINQWAELLQKFDSNINLDNIISLNDSINWKRFFEARHSIPDNALTKTRELGGVSIITDTIVPPENFKTYLSMVHTKLQEADIEYLLFGHLGDCHLHFHLIPSSEQDKLCLEIYDYMIDLSAELGGVYSAEHGTGKRKRNDFKKCYGEQAVEMVRQSKLSLDPFMLLNKGNVIL